MIDDINKIKIRVETSSLTSNQQSGVAHYTRLLVNNLEKNHKTEVYSSYFNFLKRQKDPRLDFNKIKREENIYFPLKFYAKSQSYDIAPPFDIFLPKVDLTINPNFAAWPTINSKLRATVIHDLTYVHHPKVVENNNLSHLRRVVPRAIRKSDFIITISESVKREIVEMFSLNPENCLVTPIPPDESFFSRVSDDKVNKLRQKYNLGLKKYILFLGNLEPRKNLKTLVEAYQQLPAKVQKEYSLVIAGGVGWKIEDLQNSIDKLIKDGLDIKQTGYVDSGYKSALFQEASLFVMPSIYEGFGMPILEAMASGCPVITSNIPVLREVGGDAAIYVDPLDSVDISNSIEKTLKLKSNSKKLLKNVARFSWENNINNITAKTRELL